jgi:hypothetical protein
MMRTVKTLATFIFVSSGIYAVSGAYLIWRSVNLKHTLAYYGVRETTELYIFTVGTYIRVLLVAGIFFVTCGAIALIVALGLLRAKEWARRFWLGIVLMVSIINIPWLAWCYLTRDSAIEQTLQVMFTFILTAVSWALLPQHHVKSLFQPEMAQPD